MASGKGAVSVDRASFDLRVRSNELDAYGHVNNAAYQHWFEEGREEFLRAGGRDYDWFPAHLGVQFGVVRTELDFRKPAKRHDPITVHTRLAAVSPRKVVFRQTAADQAGQIVAAARTVMVFAKEGKSQPVPEDFRTRFSPSPEGDSAEASLRAGA